MILVVLDDAAEVLCAEGIDLWEVSHVKTLATGTRNEVVRRMFVGISGHQAMVNGDIEYGVD
jgi:hypothetical protein